MKAQSQGGKMSGYRLIQSFLLVGVIWLPLSLQAAEAPEAVSGAMTIDAQEAKYLHDLGAVFIDVRDEVDWQMGHIEGAIHLDFQDEFNKLYHANIEQKSIPIVIYCNGTDCLRSAYASAISAMWGFTQVYYFRGGYFAWMLEDYPMNTGQMLAIDG